MPRILHRAMLERLLRLTEVRTFVDDFRTLTNMDLQLLDEFGCQVAADLSPGPLCHAVQQSPEGRKFCNRTRQRLLDRGNIAPASCACDAGLNEVSIPLQISGQTAGFFAYRGFRHGPVRKGDMKRFKHLLGKSGVQFASTRHRSLLDASPAISREAAGALARIVAAMATHFGFLASHRFHKDRKPLPALAHRARRYIRANGLTGRCRMQDVARACNVSPSHLSRVFHQSTGLTISEYLARFRVDHVIGLLKNRRLPVTEIAFASGFQTLSQFNRTFKRITGCAPTRFDHSAPPGLPKAADADRRGLKEAARNRSRAAAVVDAGF